MNKDILIPLSACLIVLSFSFCWFAIRPADIRKHCLEQAVHDTYTTAETMNVDDFDSLETKNYEDCLIESKL